VSAPSLLDETSARSRGSFRFGWFFAEIPLWTLYSTHSYGSSKMTRAELEFLMRRRVLRKNHHEWSQTADFVD